jgi:hypothetical protein
VDFLQPGHGEVQRLDLRHGGDLRQGEDQAAGQLAGRGQPGHEEIQGPQAPGPGGGFETLEADADERGRAAGGDCGGHRGSRGDSSGVLGVVAPVPVSVLKIEPEVLDRFGFQLGLDPRGQGLSEAGFLAQQAAQAGQAPVGVRRRERLGAPIGRERRRETVRRHVDGMHWLP